jgi:hypothetical protein
MERDPNTTKETIELAAEAIFNVLYHEGAMDLQELRSKVDIPTDVFNMAVGSLVAKDDIQLRRNGDTLIVHRTSPAPAVFAFRGN